jgi:hypothetical protein
VNKYVFKVTGERWYVVVKYMRIAAINISVKIESGSGHAVYYVTRLLLVSIYSCLNLL